MGSTSSKDKLQKEGACDNKNEIEQENQEIQQKDLQLVDINSLKHQDIRQIGAEHLGVSAVKQLGLEGILASVERWTPNSVTIFNFFKF